MKRYKACRRLRYPADSKGVKIAQESIPSPRDDEAALREKAKRYASIKWRFVQSGKPVTGLPKENIEHLLRIGWIEECEDEKSEEVKA